MKKSIIMVFAFCTCLLVAQDIEGTYRATGQRVEYQYYTRPNTHLDSGNADGSTSLVITDAYGLGVAQEISNIPAGYNFGSRVVGPIGLPEMDAMLYNLYGDMKVFFGNFRFEIDCNFCANCPFSFVLDLF